MMTTPPTIERAGDFMARHSRSFRLASLVLPPDDRARIERVYAWCRCTDNIADVPPQNVDDPVRFADRALDDWLLLSRRAYSGIGTGLPLLDRVMTEMRVSGASFDYAGALVEGVRSDLRFKPFRDMTALREYTFSVASVVGLWLCALNDVRDPWMLQRAAALGHAMQLTNILRDVGEDLDAGRLYLPLDALAAHDLTRFDLERMRAGAPVDERYRALMEHLMAAAESDYMLAREAIPLLPKAFGRSVALAAAVYAGIHDALRANGYDNFSRRAMTSPLRKIALGTQALWGLTARAYA